MTKLQEGYTSDHKKRRKRLYKSGLICLALLICTMIAAGCTGSGDISDASRQSVQRTDVTVQEEVTRAAKTGLSLSEQALEEQTPAFIVINENEPSFSQEQLQTNAYEYYSELDELGRCGAAQAVIGRELMPEGERESIGQVKPSGWHTVKYDQVDGKYLYNRCHLIGYQLTAEQANEKNLITGTRFMNVQGMLPFENMVADYIKETGNHVMYRVTPVYEGDNLVASGVEMEAESVEDQGEGIRYHVYVYNVQPGIAIDYATGDSWEITEEETSRATEEEQQQEYVLNTSSKKFHRPDCSGVKDMKSSNKEIFRGNRETLIEMGYDPCGRCLP